MKNKLLISSFRKIWHSKKKFLSLLCLALLGVGFFAGIKATSPDMTKTLDKYLKDNNVYDIEITSTLGLTDSDIEELKKLNIAKEIVGSKYTDEIITVKDVSKTARILSLTDINKAILKEGTLPNKKNELVVEEAFLEDNELSIGDVIKLDSTNLSTNIFKIVGVVESPIYFTSYRGTTNVGSGELNYYFYTIEEAFSTDYYTNIYLTLNQTSSLITDSSEYQKEVESIIAKIDTIKEKQEDARFNNLFGDTIKTLENNHLPVNMDNFPSSTWYLFDRTDNNAYITFTDSAQSIKKIGSVFPLIFYLVAILISLVSMSRMVEEERLEIGTLKGLGFANYHIYIKNLLYAFLATTIGGFIGMFIGFKIIPSIIWNIYTNMFSISNFVVEFNFYYGSIGLFIALLCICGSSIITTYNILREKPSELMRPKAPKIGKKIFLERFKFWDKLRFSTKISIRNIFRYKKRIIITIIGLAGSTALLLVGFGLKDSVTDIVRFNYNNVFIYDRMLYLANNDLDELNKLLDSNDTITDKVEVRYEVINLYNQNKDSLEVNLIVPQNEEELSGVIKLNDINNKKKEVTIKDDYIILSEKLAKMLKVKVGDKVLLLIDDEYKEIEVSNIVENYIRDYAYLSLNSYKKLFQEYSTNVILINNNDDYNEQFDEEIIKNTSVANLIKTTDTSNLISDILSSLNSVVAVLIVSSALLAFVILYNLSSINISERKREISTLKVLGFYDEEVDRYITNENYFITIVGIVLGLVAGLYLCHYVISTCEMEYVMFVRHIKPFSYIISVIISIIFTVIVSRITHYNLKKIDMVESLKSNE